MPAAMKSGNAAKAKASKTEQKKREQHQKDLKNAAQVTKQRGEEEALAELTAWLKAHPAECASILASVKAKAWENETESEDEDRLPAHQNKLRCLPKAKLAELIALLVPGMTAWLAALPKKVKKEEVGAVLSFMCHMSYSSALPSKVDSKLKRELRLRWEQCGKRGSTWTPVGNRIQAQGCEI